MLWPPTFVQCVHKLFNYVWSHLRVTGTGRHSCFLKTDLKYKPVFDSMSVRYRMFSLYCTHSRTKKSGVYWNLSKLKLDSKKFGSISFKPFFYFCNFFITIREKHTFFFGPFKSDLVDTMSIIFKMTPYVVIKKIVSQLYLYFLRHTWRKHFPTYLVLV